jgi:muramoyltetrapeptide carboxypeptidase
MMPIVKPTALRRGDTISVVAPAGPVNRDRIDRALARVRERGFHVKTHGDIYRSRGYLAGDDATRAAELMAAFADPESAAVWCARGGYGVVRILERIDFDAMRCHPKVFVGFSDITALHLVIQKKTGLITFHGPNLQDGFGQPDDMPLENEAALWRAIRADDQCEGEPSFTYDITGMNGISLRTISPGKASGRLTGGNLAVLCGLMGTPFEIETGGCILFLEDVSERCYRIDRYLSQLRQATKLQSVAGVLLGSFSYDDGEEAESPSAVAALFEEYFAPLNVPVLAGFPAGHERLNLVLPMGAQIMLDADARRITWLDNPVIAN